MFKISEATAIAIHAMIYIANREEQVISLKEISDKFNISSHHLSKVLQRLVKSGLLISTKGSKGGFLLVAEHKNSSFFAIYEIIEGKYKSHTCLFNANVGNCETCIMGNLISKIDNEFLQYMQNHKISDFKL